MIVAKLVVVVLGGALIVAGFFAALLGWGTVLGALPGLRELRARWRSERLQQAVERGSALLDEREPGWHGQIREEQIGAVKSVPLDALYSEEYLSEVALNVILDDYLAVYGRDGRDFIDAMAYFGFWADPDQWPQQRRLWQQEWARRNGDESTASESGTGEA